MIDTTPFYRKNILDYLIYECVVGSVAYGLNNDSSDIDTRGIFVAENASFLGISSVPEQIEFEGDRVYWELNKFVRLAAKGNPSILEALFTPIITQSTELSYILITNRTCFLSNLCYNTYRGYAQAQLHKALKREAIDYKNLMHLIRLLIQGTSLFKTGEIQVSCTEEEKETLLAIRNGEYSIERIKELAALWQKNLDEAYENSKLPNSPDYLVINDIIWQIRGIS